MRRTVLYEVIKRKYDRVSAQRTLGRPSSTETSQSVPYKEKNAEPSKQQKTKVGTSKTSQMFGYIPRKRGLLISYPVVVLLAMAIVTALLSAFRLGQIYSPIEKETIVSDVVAEEEYTDTHILYQEDMLTEEAPSAVVPVATTPVADKESTSTSGDHVIVIATYKRGEDLVPVKEYFQQNGIETEIQERGDYYFLVTKNKLQSPRREGTNGYYALERIKQVGADYKAPQGYESFAPNLFQDAYGMKIR